MPPTSTIIITGGTGSLGSSLARTLATSYPGDFHLVLTCRNTTDSRALSISEFLTSKNSSFSIDKLDLSDLEDVKTFAERVKSKTAAGEIPGLVGGGVVNSAAYMTFLKDSKTKDGLDAMYTINCLAPALLLRCLLPVLVGKAGSEGGVATVVNVGTAAHEVGQVDYFEKQKEGNKNAKEGERLGFPEGMKRYGSSKLLTVMTAYAFQRQLHSAYPDNKVRIVTLDPGSMNAGGRLLGDEHHWVFPVLYGILGVIRPVLRLVKKDAINPPAVPAKAIAGLFGKAKEGDSEAWKTGKYFVLDDEKKSSPLSLVEGKQDEVWKMVSRDLAAEESLKFE